MTARRRALVRQRARDRCEYCQISQADLPRFPFHVEHVIPRKHRGGNELDNLCWSCHLCNLFKSSNLSGVDPETGAVVRIFNPRRQQWKNHFQWQGPKLVGRTACGRTTIEVLCINLPHRLNMRQYLIIAGAFPPRRTDVR